MHPELQAHPDYFKKEVVQLADNVYQAYGFAASNVYMIIGDGGVVIVDTTETTTAATNVLAEFRKITALPIKTIILSHSHRDHVSGASVFAEGGTPEILQSARESGDPLLDVKGAPRAAKAMQMRTKRQFGIGLSYPDEIIGIGVGPGDRPLQGMGAGIMEATRRIENQRETITTCGLELELVHAPGETPDHIVVWYADKKVLISGDNFYRSFPNLYAIRGTEYRDFDAWADTLDLLASFNAEVLGPGHTKAIFGAGDIKASLEGYRDGIRYVIDETRKGMDEGKTIDELAATVKLPPDLAERPYLREYYGRVEYAVRAYFVGTMGWFDGNPTSLSPLAPEDEASRFVEMAGGADAVMDAIVKARADGEFQWALQLIDRLIYTVESDPQNLKSMKAEILREHAVAQINCPTRHYYIQSAKELEGG